MKIIISGLINIETTTRIRHFPIEYYPIDYPFFGISSSVSGVGFNICKALNKLGDDTSFFAFRANDLNDILIKQVLKKNNINDSFMLHTLKETPSAVVLYDENGKRQIYCDLKDWQEKSYPVDEKVKKEIINCDALVICNSNMNRMLLKEAKALNKLIVSDVHVLANPNDDYNKDFMQYADILFLSDEATNDPYTLMRNIEEIYHNKIIVMGRGKYGSSIYIAITNELYDVYSVDTRKIISTVGAGDALLSCFLHFYLKNKDALLALKLATLFASYKIGEKGAAEGFLSETELLALAEKYPVTVKRIY